MAKEQNKTVPEEKKRKKLVEYVDGEADTFYEYCMLFLVVLNSISIGLETSPSIMERFGTELIIFDQICLWIFTIELIVKFFAYKKNFFGEFRSVEDPNLNKVENTNRTVKHRNGLSTKIWLKLSNRSIEERETVFFHFNRWNIFDLIIVIFSFIGTIPYLSVLRIFRVFRSIKIIKALRALRIVKALKMVNGVSRLRMLFKAILNSLPSILGTFCLLFIITYVYAIFGTNLFREQFPLFFGTLGQSLISLCQIATFDSWVSQIARPVSQVYSKAFIYFISYAFTSGIVVVNVIVAIMVDSIEKARVEYNNKENKNYIEVTNAMLYNEIKSLKKQIEELSKKEE